MRRRRFRSMVLLAQSTAQGSREKREETKKPEKKEDK